MNKNVILSSVICCVALNGVNKSLAMEHRQIKNIDAIERKATVEDERYVVRKTILKNAKSDIASEILELKPYEKVNVLEEEKGWAKVKVKDNIGYISLKDLRKVSASVVSKYLECLDYLTVYKDISCQKESEIGRVYNTEKINILEEEDSYIKINFNGEEAFIKNKKEYLVDKRERIIEAGTKIYSSLNSTSFKEIKTRTSVIIEEEIGEYYKISYSQNYGYVKKKDVLDIKYVKGTLSFPIKLYVEDFDTSGVRSYIAPGSEVQIIEYGKEYVKIKYGEYEGYVLYSDLSIEDQYLTTYNNVLNHEESVYLSSVIIDRDAVETKYNEIIERYKANEKEKVSKFEELLREFKIIKKKLSDLKVMSNKGKYIEVELNGKIYYMDNQGQKIKKNKLDAVYIETYPELTTKVNTRYIDGSDTNVYLDESRKISLGVLAQDTQVEFIEDVNRNTSKIRINGSYLYIEKERLSTEKMYTVVKEDIKNKNTGKSHKSYVQAISKYLNVFVGTEEVRNASEDEIAYYSNPKNRSVKDDDYKYQYLRLDEFRMVSANTINEYLNSLEGKDGINIFENKAEVFIESAKKYNIDPVYLIAHTMLETGYGTSNLARGQVYEAENVTVYNFFGIGAIDSDPLEGGKRTAFENGWTSIDKTIEGSAKWLSLNYIHSETNNQNTLYKMRYNYMTRSHQYASDIMWASKISIIMQKLSNAYIDTTLKFEVPVYEKGTYVKGVSDSSKKLKKEKEQKQANKIEDSPENGEVPQKDNAEKEEEKEFDENTSEDKPIVNENEDKDIVETPEVGDENNNEEVIETPEVGDGENDDEVKEPEVGEEENGEKEDVETEETENEEMIKV